MESIQDILIKRTEERIKFLQNEIEKELNEIKKMEEDGDVATIPPIVFPKILNDNYKPYTVIKNLITKEEGDYILDWFEQQRQQADPLLSRLGDYSLVLIEQRVKVPELEKRIEELFPDMMVFSSHYFSGSKPNGVYSTWHTGINVSRPFKNRPKTYTLWIPLQSLTESTGGRLWYYNGDHLKTVGTLCHEPICAKHSAAYVYLTVDLMEDELERHKITEDCQFGDGFLFSEMNPHGVDTNCIIKRDVISFRLLDCNAEEDDLIDYLEGLDQEQQMTPLEKRAQLNRMILFCNKMRHCRLVSKGLPSPYNFNPKEEVKENDTRDLREQPVEKTY